MVNKRICIRLFAFDGNKEKEYFRQDVFVSPSVSFDYSAVRDVLLMLFPKAQFIEFLETR